MLFKRHGLIFVHTPTIFSVSAGRSGAAAANPDGPVAAATGLLDALALP
jgi:hypothetical protein